MYIGGDIKLSKSCPIYGTAGIGVKRVVPNKGSEGSVTKFFANLSKSYISF